MYAITIWDVFKNRIIVSVKKITLATQNILSIGLYCTVSGHRKQNPMAYKYIIFSWAIRMPFKLEK